jgi:hypothetical protein
MSIFVFEVPLFRVIFMGKSFYFNWKFVNIKDKNIPTIKKIDKYHFVYNIIPHENVYILFLFSSQCRLLIKFILKRLMDGRP